MAGTTIKLPSCISESNTQMGHQIVTAILQDGIFQVALDPHEVIIADQALANSRRYFEKPFAEKVMCMNDKCYSGYVPSGTEKTGGQADASEIFTICKDIPLTDPRARRGVPCHGPVPWPDDEYKTALLKFMTEVMGSIGDRLLKLIALGLGWPIDYLKNLAADGWHHARVLRFKSAAETDRGIGPHTDYGLLVLAYQDDVGGLYIRPPISGERRPRNWLPDESTAGLFEDAEGWNYVRPIPNVVTAFPGDIMQLLTGGYVVSTPHKVVLNDRERFAIAYFHEPNFDAIVKPYSNNDGMTDPVNTLHYGSHFTQMFMRCYPEKATTARLVREIFDNPSCLHGGHTEQNGHAKNI